MAFLEKLFAEVGYSRVVLQTDGDPAIIALARAVVRARNRESEDSMTQILLRQSPPGSHSSNGMAEVTVKSIESLTHTRVFQKHYNVTVKGDSAILGWIVRHAAFIYNRFMVKPTGRTPLEELKLIRYDSPVLASSERLCLAASQECRTTA
jgi:hypothetical protein